MIPVNNVTISVIMLTYNRELLVKRAIKSIQRQTFTDFEFIIVDNGSIDASGDIAEKCAMDDSRISVLHIERSSIAKGRNVGLSAATGKYIAFIDDDDYAEHDMLEFLCRLISDHEAEIALCGSTKEVNGEVFPNYIFDDFLIMNKEEAVVEMLRREKYNVALPTKLVKRELFDDISFAETSKYDDIWIGYKLFAKAQRTVAHGVPKYCFCRHESNNSAFTTSDLLISDEQLEEYINAFRERTLFINNTLPDIGEYALYSEYSWIISMCNKIISNDLTHCKEKFHYMREILFDNYDWFYNCPFIKDFEKEYMRKYIHKDRSYC